MMETLEPDPRFQDHPDILETVPFAPALNVRLALGVAVRLNAPSDAVQASLTPALVIFQFWLPASVSVLPPVTKRAPPAELEMLTVSVPVAALTVALPSIPNECSLLPKPPPLAAKMTEPFVVTLAPEANAIPLVDAAFALPANVKVPPFPIRFAEPVNDRAAPLPPPAKYP